jgi:hypothetical protein
MFMVKISATAIRLSIALKTLSYYSVITVTFISLLYQQYMLIETIYRKKEKYKRNKYKQHALG